MDAITVKQNCSEKSFLLFSGRTSVHLLNSIDTKFLYLQILLNLVQSIEMLCFNKFTLCNVHLIKKSLAIFSDEP